MTKTARSRKLKPDAPEKHCPGCRQVKPAEMFSRDATATDGRQTRCKDCQRKARQARKADEAARAVDRARWGRNRRDLRDIVFGHYGSVCACCGSSQRLTLDHVNGDGRERRLALFGTSNRGGVAFYRWVVAQGFPSDLQVLCARCNTAKNRGARCLLYHGAPDAKRCTACGKVKPLAEFHRASGKADGRVQRCRECASAARRAIPPVAANFR